MTKSDESKLIYIMRAIGIFSVICAHTNIKYYTNSFISYCAIVLNNVGTIGVGIFFFCSGFYFNLNCFGSIKNRFKKMIMPWILASLFLYLSIILLNDVNEEGDFILSYIAFFLGKGSLYYFITDYFLILVTYSLAYQLTKNTTFLFIAFSFVNLISIYLEQHGVELFTTSYMNYFIFIGYFAFGIWFRDKGFIEKIVINKSIVFLFALFFVLITKYRLSYWCSPIFYLYELGVIVCCIPLSYYMLSLPKPLRDNILIIGRESYFIYLWHLFLLTVTNFLGNYFHILLNFVIVWPIVNLLIMLIALRIMLKCNNDFLKKSIGLI